MEFFTSLMIAIGLAMDVFAVSLGIGTTGQGQNGRAKFRLAFHMGLFQALMTLIGWLAGSTIASIINGVDHWIALALLAYVGINMVRSGCNPDCDSYQTDPSRGKTLMMLCVATSLDAAAVGLGMAMLRTPVVFPSVIIGLVSTSLSLIGLSTGRKLGEVFGKRMEILGGVILIIIGLRILATHLTA